MRFAGWIPKAISTHLEYVTLIVFPQQQRLPERASILRYTYTVCLFNIRFRNWRWQLLQECGNSYSAKFHF